MAGEEEDALFVGAFVDRFVEIADGLIKLTLDTIVASVLVLSENFNEFDEFTGRFNQIYPHSDSSISFGSNRRRG